MTTTEHIDQTPQPIPNGWSIYAYVLLVEVRTCECCGTEYTAPARNLRVGIIQRGTGAKRTISLPDLHKFYSTLPKQLRKEYDNPVLPREVQHLSTMITSCPACFHEVGDEQPDMLSPGRTLRTPEEVRFAAEYAMDMDKLLHRMPDMAEVEQALAEHARKKRKPVRVKPAGTLDLTSFVTQQAERMERKAQIKTRVENAEHKGNNPNA